MGLQLDQHRDRKWQLGIFIATGFWPGVESETTSRYAGNHQLSTNMQLSANSVFCTAAACCATLPTRAFTSHHHEPVGKDCVGGDHPRHATVSFQLRLRHSPSSTTTEVPATTRAVGFWQRGLLVKDEHRQRGEECNCYDTPWSV